MERIDWKKFYNKTALQRDSLKELGPVKIVGDDSFSALIRNVQSRLRNSMKVLDVGCGTGHVILEIYKTTDKDVKFMGIDNSKEMINIAKRKSEGLDDISFKLTDAFNTNLTSKSFDIIVDRLGPMCYDEICRILKKNGLFFLFISGEKDWKVV